MGQQRGDLVWRAWLRQPVHQRGHRAPLLDPMLDWPFLATAPSPPGLAVNKALFASVVSFHVRARPGM